MIKRLTLCLLVVLQLAVFSKAWADEEPVRLGISPLEYGGPYFDLTLRPGESRQLKVEVGNYGKGTTEARTFAADVYTIVNGGFGARLDNESQTRTTLWLDYPTKVVELAPGKGLQQTFTVIVPGDAVPGEYITSLVVQNARPIEGGGGDVALRQVQRQAIAVAITVPGARMPALTIDGFEYRQAAGASLIVVSLSNPGNVRLKPAGEFVLHDDKGSEVTRYPVIMDSFYAWTSTTVEIPFAGTLNPGSYAASLTLAAEGTSVTSGSVRVDVPEPKKAPAALPPGSELDQRAQINQRKLHSSSSWWLWAVVAIVGVLVLMSLYPSRRAWSERVLVLFGRIAGSLSLPRSSAALASALASSSRMPQARAAVRVPPPLAKLGPENPVSPPPLPDFNGPWRVINTVANGREAGEVEVHDIRLSQNGSRVNGGNAELLIHGTIDGETANLQYGHRTLGYTGVFSWRILPNGSAYGSFKESPPRQGTSQVLRAGADIP